ncbi:Small auxin-up RNA [Arabidopsis thaliana x Arabidopsis arenosa]|uniref:Small auxin-up RNA n=1 Tax=Arabidopsis thaliana x Arabidopsis arenosa TaxID=1240361 RepID=A0A8T2A4I0_9BRAS|nr:Small auxin-up RNA [Arabidopsis thaliana x Arabidopsis arenosa]
MEAKKSNKIREIVKLQQLLKKWRKQAIASKAANNNNEDNNSNGGGSKGIKFLKRTLSFTDATAVPKGYLAVSVGLEKKRYTIPTEYLSHQAFYVLLREAEEEFGFQQAGVLRIPCEVSVFETILKIMEEKNEGYLVTTITAKQECKFNAAADDKTSYRHPSDCPKTPSHQPHNSPMCR